MYILYSYILQNTFNKFFKIYLLFLTALSLCCWAWAFSSCWAQASHHGGVSCYKPWAVGTWALIVVVHQLSCPSACGISQIRDQSCVPCIGRWIYNLWPTRNVYKTLLWIIILIISSKSNYSFSNSATSDRVMH